MYSEKINSIQKTKLFKNDLKDQKHPLGTFLHLNGRGIIEILSRSGFDYVVIDAEHGPFNTESIETMIDTSNANDITPLVRIPEISRAQILKTLDIGAKGLIVPYIETVEEVKELIKHAKYAPLGSRGYCPSKTSIWATDEWAKNADEYMRHCNSEQLIIPQCETKGAYDHIEEIVCLEGVDGIFIGPLDLSIALGTAFDLDSDVMKEAIQKILDICKKYNKYAFIFAGSIDKAKEYYELGFDSVAYSLDASLFMKASTDIVNLIKTK